MSKYLDKDLIVDVRKKMIDCAVIQKERNLIKEQISSTEKEIFNKKNYLDKDLNAELRKTMLRCIDIQKERNKIKAPGGFPGAGYYCLWHGMAETCEQAMVKLVPFGPVFIGSQEEWDMWGFGECFEIAGAYDYFIVMSGPGDETIICID